MLEASYRTGDNRLVFKVSAPTVKELFGEIAELQQIFEAEATCRLCNTPAPRFVRRPTDKGDYFELQCVNPQCGGRFSFGQLREGGGLFPKRKDDQGNYLPDGGWHIYRKEGSAPRQSSAPSGRSSSGPPPQAPDDSSRW